MTMDEKVASDVQAPDLGTIITLFELDASKFGGTTYRWTPMTEGGSTITWQGNVYTPISIETEGFEFTGKQFPRPKIRLSNVTLALIGIIVLYDDLLGCEVTRKRTLYKYLDGQPAADPTAAFPDDLYVVEQKTAQNKYFVEFELSAYLDQRGLFLPRRLILKNTCTHIYRYYDAGAFVYTQATCPYTEEGAGKYFVKDGTPTSDPYQDVCGKRLSDCRLRFDPDVTYNEKLYTRAFPRVAGVRV